MKRCWEYLYLFLTKRNCHTIPVFTLHGTVIHVGLGVRDPNVLDGSSTDGRKNRGASWGGSWSALESEYDSKQKIHLFVKRLNGSRLNQWSLTWAVHQVSKAPQKNARKIRGSQKVFNGTPKLYCRNKIFQIENWIKSPPPCSSRNTEDKVVYYRFFHMMSGWIRLQLDDFICCQKQVTA